jgi:protein phosphatase
MDSNKNYVFQHSHISDVGCVRELNEDSLFFSDELWLVADGMGGHACGEVASQLAAQEIAKNYAESGVLSDAIQAAHKKVVEAGESDAGQSGMGTTVVALSSFDENYEIAWVGDSRAYLWDITKRKITQISEDHSLIVRLIKSGLISAEEAKNHPQRHMITQCLGSVEIKQLQVDTVKGQWAPNQKILLCSDGLTDDVTSQEMLKALQQHDDNESRLSTLVDMAKNAGGKDNISIIIVDSPIFEKPSFFERLKSVFKR